MQIVQAVPGPDSATAMPPMSIVAYGKTQSLIQPEIANIIAYVMHLNNVNRAQIEDAEMAPEMFFFVCLGFLLVLWSILGTFRFVSIRKRNRISDSPR